MGTPRSDPSALRFLIGHDLRGARERAGVKQVEAGKILGCSQAKINYLETGKTQQKPDEVALLLRSYGADVDHVDRLTSLAGRADQATWWAPFSEVLPDWFKTFVGLEGLATVASTYASLVLPGQLQIPEYATALLAGNLRVPPLNAPQVVQARMARQRLTDSSNPLWFRAVIEEYALERLVGGRAVMQAQLEHLLRLMERDHIELHVMPATVAVHDGLDGNFLLLDFDDAQSIGYIEYPTGALYIQDDEHLATYALSVKRLCATALSASASADAITSRLDTLRSGGAK